VANLSRKFYALAGELIPALNRWSPTHQFIRLLQDKGKLLRNYTQNIDNVESYAGIQPERVIHCHGSWKSAKCRKCKTTVPGEQIFDALRRKVVATCQSCTLQAEGLKRKRPTGASKPRKKTTAGDFEDDEDEDDDIPTPGVMKPDITFFGESLPKIFYDTVNGIDRPLVDLVIVIGTSMKVAPVSEIPHHIQHSVPSIYISRDVRPSLLRGAMLTSKQPIMHIEFDINLLGNCDTIVAEMCRRAGWELKHGMLPPPGSAPPSVAAHGEHEWAYTVTEQAETAPLPA
jgi:NAD-dependent histone deacetylase SIR2